MLRSLDGGGSWQHVGGPSNYRDSRFCVCPSCDGAVVVAFDTVGGVWLTTNGGDGALSNPPMKAVGGPPLLVHSCEGGRVPVVLTNSECISILADSLVSNGKGKFILEPHDSLLLARDAADTLWFDFAAGTDTGTYQAKLHVRGAHPGAGTMELDTIITVTAHVAASTPKLVEHPTLLNISPISICTTADTTIYILNLGCDTLRVDSITVAAASGIQFGAISKPDIAPRDSIAILLHYQPQNIGAYDFDIAVHGSSQGAHTTSTVPVHLDIIRGTARFVLRPAITSFQFPRLSHCDGPDSLVFWVFNRGCDSLRILGKTLVDSSGTFEAISGSPTTLVNGDSTEFIIRRFVQSPGIFTSSFSIRYELPDGSLHDTSVTLTAETVRGTRTLSIDTSLRDFGAGSLCRTADTTIILQNTGCDTLHLTSMSITAATGFALNSAAPKSLPPGVRDTIEVLYSPLATGISQDVLSIGSDADNDPSIRIRLNAQTYGPEHVMVSPVLPRPTSNIDDTVTLFIVANRNVSVAGLKTMNMSLQYNADLLTPITSQSNVSGMTLLASDRAVNSVGEYDMKFSGTGSAVSFDAANWLASVRFHTSLSKTFSTPIGLSNLELNGGDPAFARCVLTANTDSTNLTLLAECGDSLISNTMTGSLSLRMLGIYPDPAQTSIVAEVESQVSATVTIEIYDLSGARVFQGTQRLTKGKNSMPISIKSLSEASYILRVRSAPDMVELGFVKRIR